MAYEFRQGVRKCFATDFGELPSGLSSTLRLRPEGSLRVEDSRVAILGPRLANDGVPGICGRVR